MRSNARDARAGAPRRTDRPPAHPSSPGADAHAAASAAFSAPDMGDLVCCIRSDAIFALDPQGTVLSWNSGAEELTGYPADQAVGTHFAILHTAEDRRAGLPAELLATARE